MQHDEAQSRRRDELQARRRSGVDIYTQKTGSHRLNERVYTLLMVVDGNRHGDRRAAGLCDAQPTCFSAALPPPAASSASRQSISPGESESVLSGGGLTARGEGHCGKAERRGSDVVWPLASFKCSQNRRHY